MSYAFYNCSSLNYLEVSNFNTLNVKKMQYMFASCTSLKSLNIGSFFTANVENENLENMFEKDEGLELYMDYKTCANLKQILPTYITTHDIS